MIGPNPTKIQQDSYLIMGLVTT